jgi:hypothetical protein
MLQRLKEIRKFEKKKKMKLIKEETHEINYMKELVTLQMLAKSDLKKFMAPQDDNEIVEDTDAFLTDILGYNENSNFELSDGFKVFPPIKPVLKNKSKKKGLRFDAVSHISTIKQSTYDAESKYPESDRETRIDLDDLKSEKSIMLNKRNSKPELLKNITKASRNRNNFLSPQGNKTEALPSVNKKIRLQERNKSNSKALVAAKGKSKISQLAITDGSKFPARKGKNSLETQNKNIGSKTSRMFAPKLNKDLPVSPKQLKIVPKKAFGAVKMSMNIIEKR